MFNSITHNEMVPKGKKTFEQSRKLFESNFKIGDNNYQNKYESVTNHFYKPKQPSYHDMKYEHINASHWSVAEKTNIAPTDHYKTETKQQFDRPRNTERVGPVRDKTSLLKSHYTLGEERVNYETTTHSQFGDKSKIKVPETNYRQPERYDIVNNSNKPVERVEGASNFDFYNPHREKKRTSNNQTDYPLAGVKLDPITRRILPTSYMIYDRNFKELKK